MTVSVKRVYDVPSSRDGTRILVDRLWPRGLSKQRAAIDHWLRPLAPSTELRRWYHSSPEEWATFRARYLKELAAKEAADALRQLYSLANKGKVTLLFASRSAERNNATVLKELLEGARKPPTGTGPATRAMRLRKTARRPKK